MKKKRFLSDSDAHYVVKDAEKILAPDRRRLLQQGLTLGGIMMLTGCVDWPPESPDNQYHLNK
ncbi:oxidoreductase [Escherichia coli]|nr:oxidoreductase [Escherichia coli]